MATTRLAAGVLFVSILLAGCTGTGADGTPAAGNGTAGDAAFTDIPLTDVRSGESFTLGQFEGPVLVETFAVWCSTCLRQQRELQDFHADYPDVVSVTVNTDPNEDAATVRRHLDEHGFDWRYAVAPTEMIRALRDRFGSSILIPPRAPMVLVCPDGSVTRLPDGVKPASQLADAIETEC